MSASENCIIFLSALCLLIHSHKEGQGLLFSSWETRAMMLSQGKRAEMSLTFWFPGLWSNPESPFLSHHHTCPFGSIPLPTQEKIQQPGSSDSRVPAVVHTLINEDKPPIVLMLRGWNDTRRKTVFLQAVVAGGEIISSYLNIY